MTEALETSKGEALDARYTLLDRLGAGGQGEVWRAHDGTRGVDIALKLVKPAPGREENAWRALEHEYAIASGLDHPSILKVFAPERIGESLVLPMELASGGDLRRLRGAGFLEIIPSLLEIAQALEYAHEHGVVHRDLKPGNVLFDARGRARLADFGVAEQAMNAVEASDTAANDAAPAVNTTRDTNRHGFSPFTASPAQLRGEPPTPADDIYGLGALAYELLSGYPPYYPHFDKKRAIEDRVPMLVPTRQIPPLLGTLVMNMLAKNPKRRPRTMREVIDELDAAINDTLTYDFENVSPATPTASVAIQAAAARALQEAGGSSRGGPSPGENPLETTSGTGRDWTSESRDRRRSSDRRGRRKEDFEQSADDQAGGRRARDPSSNGFAPAQHAPEPTVAGDLGANGSHGTLYGPESPDEELHGGSREPMSADESGDGDTPTRARPLVIREPRILSGGSELRTAGNTGAAVEPSFTNGAVQPPSVKDAVESPFVKDSGEPPFVNDARRSPVANSEYEATQQLPPLSLDATQQLPTLSLDATQALRPLSLEATQALLPLSLEATQVLPTLSLDATQKLPPLRLEMLDAETLARLGADLDRAEAEPTPRPTLGRTSPITPEAAAAIVAAARAASLPRPSRSPTTTHILPPEAPAKLVPASSFESTLPAYSAKPPVPPDERAPSAANNGSGSAYDSDFNGAGSPLPYGGAAVSTNGSASRLPDHGPASRRWPPGRASEPTRVSGTSSAYAPEIPSSASTDDGRSAAALRSSAGANGTTGTYGSASSRESTGTHSAFGSERRAGAGTLSDTFGSASARDAASMQGSMGADVGRFGGAGSGADIYVEGAAGAGIGTYAGAVAGRGTYAGALSGPDPDAISVNTGIPMHATWDIPLDGLPKVARLEPIQPRRWPWVFLGLLAGAVAAVYFWLPQFDTTELPPEVAAVVTPLQTAIKESSTAATASDNGSASMMADQTNTPPAVGAAKAGSNTAANDTASNTGASGRSGTSARSGAPGNLGASARSGTAAAVAAGPAVSDEQRLHDMRQTFDTRIAALEARGAGVWGGRELAMAKTRGAESVGAHDAGNTRVAQEKLNAAMKLLDVVDSRAPQAFSAQVAAGERALGTGQQEVAGQAFDMARRINPADRRAIDGQRRAQNLNAVLPLLADAQNAEAARDYARAAQDYSQALSLDLGNATAKAGQSRANAAFGDDNYARAVGSGFAALGAGRLDEAREAFVKARALKPNGAEASEGLRRVNAALSARGFASMRQRAIGLEAQERWDEAERVYEDVLAADPSLAFAQEGKARTSSRADLSLRLQQFLDRPDRLAAPAVRTDARELLETARAQSPQGPVIRSQIARLEILLPGFDKPVRLSLVSDNTTQIVIPSIGSFGTFARRDIELRPGKYTVVGTRNGFRDVRREITVAPGQESQIIRVSCSDPI
jgi:serine/threonine protein kinase/tetratricopeptide (TPR) repeat protein